MKISEYKWHQLDPGYGGYMSCRVGDGDTLMVITTPVSTKSIDDHRKILDNKVNKLKTSNNETENLQQI